MSILRVKSPGWTTKSKLTPLQISNIDKNISYMLDKRLSETDYLNSNISFLNTSTLNLLPGSTLDVSKEAISLLNVGVGGIYINSTLTTESGGRILLGDNDYPTFSTPRTIYKYIHCISTKSINSGFWTYYYNAEGIQSSEVGTSLYLNLNQYLIDGAYINAVKLTFAVGINHISVPEYMPLITVGLVSFDGSVGDTLSGTGSQDIATPATGAIWYNLGDKQTYEYICDQNNTIDLSTNIYYFRFNDEYGTNSFISGTGNGTILFNIRLDMTVNDMKV